MGGKSKLRNVRKVGAGYTFKIKESELYVDNCVTIKYFYIQEVSMKFITVRDLRTSPAQIWKQLPEEQEMIITNNGKPIALLTPVSDTNLEETVSSVRKARAINAVKQMQQFSLKEGTSAMNMESVNNEINKARKQ